MNYTKLTKENFKQLIGPFINAFNCAPNHDQWTEESTNRKWAQTLANPTFEGYMAFNDNNTFIGYIGGVHEVYFMGDTFLIEDFFVVKEVKSSGVGSELLAWLECLLKEKSVVMTRLFTAKIPEQQGYYEKRRYQTFDEIVMMGKELK